MSPWTKYRHNDHMRCSNRTPGGRWLVLWAVLALLAAPAALGDGGSGGSGSGGGGSGSSVEARVESAGSCTKSTSARLRLRSRDGWIRVAFEVDSSRNGVVWRIVALHERNLFFQGTARTVAPSGSFEVRRSVPDWWGTELISARATSPSGEVCRASARI